MLYCGVSLLTQQGYMHTYAKRIFPVQYHWLSQAAGERQLGFYAKQADDILC